MFRYLISEPLWIAHSANIIVSFCVSNFGDSSSLGWNDSITFNTSSTSHIVVYLGKGGLIFDTPFISLHISLASPMGEPWWPIWYADMVDLYEFMVLYASPFSKSSPRKTKTLFIGHSNGLIFRLSHQPVHLFQALL